MKVIFDLDGTLADIRHRVHFVRDGQKDWAAFFAACKDDTLYPHVADTLTAHMSVGHAVEIWSGRSDEVQTETEAWLASNGIDPSLLTHMRMAGDYTTDHVLKRSWLRVLADCERPDLIYDDRQRVVNMWREEGIPCFQVTANWETGDRIIAPIRNPLLIVMVGPSGGGKSTWAQTRAADYDLLSSDDLRHSYCGDFRDQSRNEDVFYALHKLASARLGCGLPVIIDATNLHRKDRLACVSLAPPNAAVQYVVCNRPMEAKARDSGWRNGVMVKGVPLLDAHEQRFNSQLKDILAGDGLPNVTVLDARETPNGH